MKLPELETVVADRLSFTVPRGEHQARGAVVRVLLGLGAVCEQREDACERYRVGSGTYQWRTSGKVECHDLSGQVLAELREAGMLLAMCQALAMCPRLRVTALDLARDVGLHGREVIPALVLRHRKGGVRVGRKRVRPGDEDWRNRLDPEGQVSGSLYLPVLGKRRALRAVVYDKRAHLLELGEVDPGPLTRTEVRCRGVSVGMTLHDVVSPDGLFWSKVGDVLERPADAPSWERRELPGRWPTEERSDLKDMTAVLRRIRPQLEWAAEFAARDSAARAALPGLVADMVAEAMRSACEGASAERRGSEQRLSSTELGTRRGSVDGSVDVWSEGADPCQTNVVR